MLITPITQLAEKELRHIVKASAVSDLFKPRRLPIEQLPASTNNPLIGLGFNHSNPPELGFKINPRVLDLIS